jgi:hypothetical protein
MAGVPIHIEYSPRLAELELVIERGLQTFVEVGNALMEIRDNRLYPHPTFDEYCQDRWGWKQRQAYNYIETSRVVQNLHLNAKEAPSLTQAVELSRLPEDQRRELAARVDFANTTVQELREGIRQVRNGESAPSLKMAVHYSSDSVEWYTPPEIIARVQKVFRQIDLDPCSNSSDSPNVPAKQHFTQEDDGLSSPWTGRVFMNPPYGDAIGAWAEKLCAEYAAVNVTEAIALVPARVDTDWFRKFRNARICFIHGRLKFSAHENSAPFPSAVVYLGDRTDAFRYAFADMGDIWVREWRGRNRRKAPRKRRRKPTASGGTNSNQMKGVASAS